MAKPGRFGPSRLRAQIAAPCRSFLDPRHEAVMPAPSRLRPIVPITGVVYALIGLALACGGVWLAALGGSLYYVIAGLGILITGALLIGGRGEALWVYAAVLIGTLVWAVSEIGFDWWPLAARGDIIFPMALWLLTPVIVRGLLRNEPVSYGRATGPLWVGVVVASVVLIIGALSSYHDINGTIVESSSQVEQSEADPQPD